MRLIAVLTAASALLLADDDSFDSHLTAGKLAVQQRRYPEARRQLDAAIKDSELRAEARTDLAEPILLRSSSFGAPRRSNLFPTSTADR